MEVFECFVCSALDVMLAPLGVIPNGLPRTEVEVEVEVSTFTFTLVDSAKSISLDVTPSTELHVTVTSYIWYMTHN